MRQPIASVTGTKVSGVRELLSVREWAREKDVAAREFKNLFKEDIELRERVDLSDVFRHLNYKEVGINDLPTDLQERVLKKSFYGNSRSPNRLTRVFKGDKIQEYFFLEELHGDESKSQEYAWSKVYLDEAGFYRYRLFNHCSSPDELIENLANLNILKDPNLMDDDKDHYFSDLDYIAAVAIQSTAQKTAGAVREVMVSQVVPKGGQKGVEKGSNRNLIGVEEGFIWIQNGVEMMPKPTPFEIELQAQVGPMDEVFIYNL